ncbi:MULTISPECIES: acyloxyacyl hydrolase [unclassified Undibacterium]|uniref:acyloxyacyl hydrolase n=1 Tax=unclassified Undibacterium TaxID=2630295 RepID=UPI002AC9EB95|nr:MULTISPECIES: acyloxyacyl hydrolase [unclassified Undibacterium]MEB0138280.1 acyloxyacyl hydrolase [Undibacterium sp. CCC2.1]MEB0171559.1 acyloxyacyl hydrolase [Undibacterium sp. CCC1.1]MEB0175521.1 acyloxyacyl hydrolase [Undibacterium sp. CCC3.4]MEB0214759.1 acyloxyacyl hydrolase [Undibacterium sp. 5I2]WPX45246.1 acyloxyacyl hydrolase [Undibacterium sp. CCC3.4]
MNRKALLAALGLLLSTTSAYALDSVSGEFASGNRSQFVRAGAQWNWDKAWFQSNGTHLGGYWDVTLTQWRNNAYQGVSGATQNITDIGITPVFRLQNDNKKGWYGEAGIGAHLFSHVYSNNNRQFSTAFQFGDHIGVGYVLNSGWDIGLKIQHFSNGAIKHPNPGANLAVIKVGRSF